MYVFVNTSTLLLETQIATQRVTIMANSYLFNSHHLYFYFVSQLLSLGKTVHVHYSDIYMLISVCMGRYVVHNND